MILRRLHPSHSSSRWKKEVARPRPLGQLLFASLLKALSWPHKIVVLFSIFALVDINWETPEKSLLFFLLMQMMMFWFYVSWTTAADFMFCKSLHFVFICGLLNFKLHVNSGSKQFLKVICCCFCSCSCLGIGQQKKTVSVFLFANLWTAVLNYWKTKTKAERTFVISVCLSGLSISFNFPVLATSATVFFAHTHTVFIIIIETSSSSSFLYFFSVSFSCVSPPLFSVLPWKTHSQQ